MYSGGINVCPANRQSDIGSDHLCVGLVLGSLDNSSRTQESGGLGLELVSAKAADMNQNYSLTFLNLGLNEI